MTKEGFCSGSSFMSTASYRRRFPSTLGTIPVRHRGSKQGGLPCCFAYSTKRLGLSSLLWGDRAENPPLTVPAVYPSIIANCKDKYFVC